VPNQREQLIAKIRQIQAHRVANRRKEQNLKSRGDILKSFPLVGDSDSIKNNLSKILPKQLVPGNIGKYGEVTWPFYLPYDFDFGTDPTFNSTTQESTIQKITQESAFLLFGLSRNAESAKDSGLYAPLQIDIKDRQSSRQYNDTPIPVQMIGHRGQPSYFDTPLYIAPNARLEVQMTSWVDTAFATVGSGVHQITLIGIRVRNEDADKVLSTIFL
jgi:hypothetical protein